jgi:hypothetical protein
MTARPRISAQATLGTSHDASHVFLIYAEDRGLGVREGEPVAAAGAAALPDSADGPPPNEKCIIA